MMTAIDIQTYRDRKIKADAHKATRAAYRDQAARDLGEPTSNFYRVSHRTIESKRFKSLSLKAKGLYFILCSHRNRYQRRKTYFTRSIRQLAQDLAISKNTVKIARQELVEQGFVVTAKNRSGRSRWQILDVKNAKSLITD